MPALIFDNRFVHELPSDAEQTNTTRAVYGAAYSRVAPTPVTAPRLLAWSREVAADLGLAPADVMSPAFIEAFAGNRLWPGMEAYAAAYGGHQFGQWAGQLGDGRAIGLGEVIGADGRRHELQLKGAGPTPYSRRADGRAVLRSSLREFLCSEAMHHLGVPTTRALCLIGTGEKVIRDMFYDGHPEAEPGAIVCRVAPSFIRFGNFELPASRGDSALLERLIDFTIARDFPHLSGPEARIAWFHEICTRTAEMVAHWMRVGFVHGVMNTDNMSILGLTMDYGPYGWLEEFDPDWTPNTTDAAGRRYAFGRQPAIAQWNLQCLAGALATVIADHDGLRAGLAAYADSFANAQARMTAAKLGLADWRDGDEALARELFRILGDGGVDYTLFSRALAQVDIAAPSPAPLEHAFYDATRRQAVEPTLREWLARWAARVRSDAEPAAVRRARMNAANPAYVLRNWMAQQAIDAATAGDMSELETLHDLLRRPYDEQPGMDRYAVRRPDWARHRAGCSMLSCSS